MAIPYVPNISAPPPANVGNATPNFGHGSPEGVAVGNLGEIYVDVDNQQFYFKASDGGGNTGWILQTGGGGGGTAQCFFGSGAPEGVQVGAVGNYYWRTATLSQYVKNSGSGNTGWVLLSGPG